MQPYNFREINFNSVKRLLRVKILIFRAIVFTSISFTDCHSIFLYTMWLSIDTFQILMPCAAFIVSACLYLMLSPTFL